MSKNNIQQTEWNKVDYYYEIGTLDDNHLDYREKGYGAHLHVSVIRLPEGTDPKNDFNGAIRRNNTFPVWGDFQSKNQKIWKNMINPFNYEDSNTWQGRYK